MKKLAVIFAAMIMAGCANTNNPSNNSYSVNPAETSLDWAGVYQGVLPCADCEGINTTLTLNNDGTFELEQAYKKGITTFIPQATTGKIVWDKSKPLIYINENNEQRTFFVGEGYVQAYDMQGKPIISQLNYTLQQIKTFALETRNQTNN